MSDCDPQVPLSMGFFHTRILEWVAIASSDIYMRVYIYMCVCVSVCM